MSEFSFGLKLYLISVFFLFDYLMRLIHHKRRKELKSLFPLPSHNDINRRVIYPATATFDLFLQFVSFSFQFLTHFLSNPILCSHFKHTPTVLSPSLVLSCPPIWTDSGCDGWGVRHCLGPVPFWSHPHHVYHRCVKYKYRAPRGHAHPSRTLSGPLPPSPLPLSSSVPN